MYIMCSKPERYKQGNEEKKIEIEIKEDKNEMWRE